MKNLTFIPLAILIFTAGAVRSQAPVTGGIAPSLQALIESNKGLIEKQKKTLDTLDALDQATQQLKTFGKRG